MSGESTSSTSHYETATSGSSRRISNLQHDLPSGDVPPAPQPAAAIPATQAQAPRVRRRNRMITSCLECRRRKLKCDKQSPCANCTKFSRDCMFLAPALDTASQLKLTEIKEKQATLDRVLEQDVVRNGAWREARRVAQAASTEDEIDFAPVPDDERDLEPTPLAIGDAVYEKGDDELEDELIDLGIAMGKMRLTDRIGGFFRPKMSEEMSVTLAKDDVVGLKAAAQMANLRRPADFMTPGPTYLPPASSFFFASNARGRSLIDYLPSQHAADHLIKQYYHAVHPVCRIVHWPSFQKRYDTFWNELRIGIEPVGSLQALIFTAMFCAVVSMPEDALFRDFAVPKKDLVDNFQQGAETALNRAQMLRTTKTETMQAFVMYLIPLCRDQMSRAHSALVGTAIRLAECMGLHRDGTAYGMNAVEVHVRRLIWYQLAMLDVRTCEAHGPRPGIREGEFDTKLPLNVNDTDLEFPDPPTKDKDEWTDMTCTLIRIQCNEMHRVIWVDRPRIEKKQITLTAVLGKVENFKRIMHERYLPLLTRPDGSPTDNPLHTAARLILTILITRMHVMILHRYHNSVSSRIPERLRTALRSAGTESVEAAMALETLPQLTPWRWIAGALQQYHAAFLLIAEVHQYPYSPEADRIWKVLDYVFEPPQGLNREQKALVVMKELRDRLEIYHTARKSKAPLALMNRFSTDGKSGKGGALPEKELFFVGGPGGEVRRSDLEPAANVLPPADSTPSGIGDGIGMPQSMPSAAGTQGGAFDAPHNLGITGLGGGETSIGHKATSFSTESVGSGMSMDELMNDIDWNEWDKLFPPDSMTTADAMAGLLAPV